ncbi:MAG: 4-alpha-glucanotransferase [Marmoricola sp.]
MADAVQEVWTDADDDEHELALSTTRALRRALGEPPRGAAQSWPVVTRPGRDPGLGAVQVTCEDGSVRSVRDALPHDFPLGYHRIREPDGNERPLIVSPGRCFVPQEQEWGWAVQLYATRSSDSWGIGDLRDLLRLRSWTERAGGGFLLINPLHAVAPTIPQEASPYLPSSRRFLNPLYLCVPEVPGHDAGDVSQAAVDAVRAGELVDRDAVAELKLPALRAAHDRGAETGAFRRWRNDQDDDVELFALYCVLADEHGADWRTWPEDLRDPYGDAARAAARERADDVAFQVWMQWQLSEQLGRAASGFTIIQDLPIGVSGSGSDAWAWQGLLADDVTVGAPPDKLNRLGQDWGSPPWVPWRLQAAGYEPFIQTVRRTMGTGGGLRIDHVMGLFRLWWIPGSADPTGGGYVRYPSDDLLDIVALESHRAGAVVVGEDLGTVEDGVSDALAERGILSYKVLWFEDDAPGDWPTQAMAAVTTHDLPTVAGLWTGTDAEEQTDLTDMDPADVARSREELLARLRRTEIQDGAPPEEAVVAAYTQLLRAPSLLQCLALEDAVGQERRPNVPGTTARRNWSVPLPVLIDDLDDSPGVQRLLSCTDRNRTDKG